MEHLRCQDNYWKWIKKAFSESPLNLEVMWDVYIANCVVERRTYNNFSVDFLHCLGLDKFSVYISGQ